MRFSNSAALSPIASRDLTLSAASAPVVAVSSVRNPISVSDSSLRAAAESAWPCARCASSALLLSSSRPATACCRPSKRWANDASSAVCRCSSRASNTPNAASSSARPLRDSATAWARRSSTAWRSVSKLCWVVCVKPPNCLASASMAPSFLATASCVDWAVCSSACSRASHSGGRSTRGRRTSSSTSKTTTRAIAASNTSVSVGKINYYSFHS